MKQTANTMTMKKQTYQTPELQVIRLETAPMLNSVSGSGDYTITYGGDGDGEYGD